MFSCVYSRPSCRSTRAPRAKHIAGKTVILRNRDITRMQAIDQRKIHAVRSFGYDDGLVHPCAEFGARCRTKMTHGI